MVGMAGIAPGDPLQGLEAVAVAGHAAARAVDEGDDTVDIRIGGELVRPEMVGDAPGRGRRTVHRGGDGDIVAGPDRAVLAAIAHEAVASGLRHHLGRAKIGREFVGRGRVSELGILGVDMVAGRDVHRGIADHLRIFAHGLALGDRADGHLVALRDHARGGDALDVVASLDGPCEGDDVVGGVEPDEVEHKGCFQVNGRRARSPEKPSRPFRTLILSIGLLGSERHGDLGEEEDQGEGEELQGDEGQEALEDLRQGDVRRGDGLQIEGGRAEGR